eukprot:Tbor_TRINITY_DN6104_c1_g2::TRINITY_DN6104_c1_g2_i9::g.21839::m.21839/K02867/RP-L11, MRPL11, rplK; large subunit ribosomal protein L11
MFAVPEYPNNKVIHNWRFFIRAGKAATGPPVGQEFSKLGLKTMEFTKAFNDRTKPVFKDDIDVIVRFQVFFDKSYNYRIEPPPTAWFILKACRLKRRESGSTGIKGSICSLITLEMIYEIAKMKQFNWSTPEYPPIETRVRRIAGQCRGMGIGIIGVDCPSSPVKGIPPKQLEEQNAKYRAEQMELYNKLKYEELERAPLIERLHCPNMDSLTYDQIKEGLRDPNMFSALWKASQPKSGHSYSEHDQRMALRAISTRRRMKEDMTLDEAKVYFSNWRLPAIERNKQLSGEQNHINFWSRSI